VLHPFISLGLLSSSELFLNVFPLGFLVQARIGHGFDKFNPFRKLKNRGLVIFQKGDNLNKENQN